MTWSPQFADEMVPRILLDQALDAARRELDPDPGPNTADSWEAFFAGLEHHGGLDAGGAARYFRMAAEGPLWYTFRSLSLRPKPVEEFQTLLHQALDLAVPRARERVAELQADPETSEQSLQTTAGLMRAIVDLVAIPLQGFR